MVDINKAVEFMIKTANDERCGYDQTHRNGPDYDCSSLIGTALHNAGFNVSPKSWTGNLESQLRKAGFKECKAPWKAGDIHLKIGKHVVMSINATQIVEASLNEKGTVTGGETGDQTGKEISIRNYYNYNWDLHLRYPETNSTNVDLESIAIEVINGKWGNGTERMDRLTNAGYNASAVQQKVNEMLTGKSNTIDNTIIERIAREVILGKWGNGEARKNRLIEAGYDYTEIQKKVNELLK